MTERQLRILARKKILTEFEKKRAAIVNESVMLGDDITIKEVRRLVRREILRRLREQNEKEAGGEVSPQDPDVLELSDMMSDQIDDGLANVMQQANQLAKSAGAGKKVNEIGFLAAIIAFPAVIEIIAKVIKVIGWGIQKIVKWWTGKEGKVENSVQKVGHAIEHWVEESLLAKGYYRAIGWVVQKLIEGTASGILKVIDKMEGRDKKGFDKSHPYLGTTTGPIARAAQLVLEESAKTDYIKVGGWIFKAISLAAITDGLKNAVTNWKEISTSIGHVLHVAVEAFEAAKFTSSAAEVLMGLLGAGVTTFAVFAAYKKLSEYMGGYEQANKIATGEEQLNVANLDVEMQRQSAAMAA